ncbi:MAG: hypothetical protein P8L77_00255 [Gammaproteobacteria bacterium]|nr:hypothetical protein [Gammaproteobacteria bacterium]
MSPFIRNYRYIVFAFAMSYWLNLYIMYGFQFLHYLTNWGLTLSVVCAGLLAFESAFQKQLRINSLVIATFCLNAVVMILYWKLYFKDPDLLYAGRTPMPWYRDDYVHLLCPLTQMFDALVFKQAFSNRLFKGVVYYLCLSFAYSICSEFLFALPYPFMWDLDLGQRVAFYAQGQVTGVFAFLIGVALSFIFKKIGLTQFFYIQKSMAA